MIRSLEPKHDLRRFASTVLAAGLGGALALTAPHASSAPSPSRVLIVASDGVNARLDEALVRVRGELSAMGLSTTVRSESTGASESAEAWIADFEGGLVFQRFGEWLRIQAFNPNIQTPVTQWVDLGDPSVDAEVIAVRAVEALRAALLPFFGAPANEHAESAPGERPEPPSSKVAPSADSSATPPPEGARERARRVVWVGPSLGADAGTGAVHLGAQVGLGLGGRSFALGVLLAASRASIRDDDAGQAELARFAVSVDGRMRIPVADRWDVTTALGAGIVHVRAHGVAEPGYTGDEGAVTSVAFSVELGAAYWWNPTMAVYASSRGTLALDAPVVRAEGRELATLERPQLGAAAGLLFGF